MLERIVETAQKHPSIIKLGVFGSYARGGQTQDSDIDLLIDYDDSQISDYLACIDEIENVTERRIDSLAYYIFAQEYTDVFSIEMKENILRDLVWIYPVQKCALNRAHNAQE